MSEGQIVEDHVEYEEGKAACASATFFLSEVALSRGMPERRALVHKVYSIPAKATRTAKREIGQ